eukprot:7716541-Lingulodinium_polyedra.AAC.1
MTWHMLFHLGIHRSACVHPSLPRPSLVFFRPSTQRLTYPSRHSATHPSKQDIAPFASWSGSGGQGVG